MQTKQVFEYKQKSRKMNVKSNMIAAAVSALMLTACHNEDVTPGTETGQDLAHFSATITQPVTRPMTKSGRRMTESASAEQAVT